jgi:hypothetical protein
MKNADAVLPTLPAAGNVIDERLPCYQLLNRTNAD